MRSCLIAMLAGCVAADDALPLGSVEFTFDATASTQSGVPVERTEDGWSIAFERVLLSFKTMTVGKIGVPDICAYRGRGAESDVVFDPRASLTQTFNGIQPVLCPDVGLIFGPPAGTTTLGAGATTAELVELANGVPAHALVDAVATSGRRQTTLRIQLRFDSERTSTRFGGCREAARGVRIVPHERQRVTVRFAAETLFGEGLSHTPQLRVEPFFQADGDGDGLVTMRELDLLSLRNIPGAFYQLPNGTRNGSFGDFVRALFRFSIRFRTDDGQCIGNEPGEVE